MQYLQSEGIDPLSEHEARQFLHHASRVHSLVMPDDRHFHLLTVLPIETCIFPRLLDFSWAQSMSIRHLRPFWSSTLRRCILPILHPDLKYIATLCPVLENLEFRTTAQHTADELSLLSETVRSCRRLKHLECPALDSAAWNHLSNLHTLVTLRNYGPYQIPLDGDHLSFAPFLNVTSLSFSVETAASIVTVMKHSEFPSLKKFKLHTVVLPWAEAEELFHALSQCNSRKTLEYLNILSWDSTPVQENSNNSSTVIRQFLCFRQLRTLHLFLGSSIYLDNDLLSEAMSSWPHICSLILVDLHPGSPTITPRGLFEALRLTPHLHTLQILVDAVNIDIDPNTESFQHTSLKEFGVCASRVQDPEAVARIIFSMLPCVYRVDYHWDSGNASMWEEVNQHLKSWAAVSQEQPQLEEIDLSLNDFVWSE